MADIVDAQVLKEAQFTVLPSTEERRFAFELVNPKDPKAKRREFVADNEVVCVRAGPVYI